MSTADLGQPILLFILVFWTLIAVAAILTSLVKKGKITGHHHRDHHHET